MEGALIRPKPFCMSGLVASHDDVSGCSTPVSMQLLDLGSILVAYKQPDFRLKMQKT